MSKITIVTVNWFSCEYILAMLDNLYTKAARPEDLRVLIADNTNGQDASIAKIQHDSMVIDILPLDSQGLKGSRGHALALDYAAEKLQTEYAVVVDPDIYVFWQNWDQFCIEALQTHSAIAVGAPYPCWKVGKYHDFPSPPFCFFHTKTIQSMDNGWEPYGETLFHNMITFGIRQVGRLGNLLTRKRYEQHLFLRKYAAAAEKIFGVFSQDTGWKLAREIRKKNLKTVIFNSVLPEDSCDIAASASEAFIAMVREYEVFTYQKHLFMAHKYGTGGMPWRTEQGDNEALWQDCIKKLEAPQ